MTLLYFTTVCKPGFAYWYFSILLTYITYVCKYVFVSILLFCLQECFINLVKQVLIMLERMLLFLISAKYVLDFVLLLIDCKGLV